MTEIIKSEVVKFVASNEPIEQGDILFWKDSQRPFERAGIIVTADCDLAWRKHWGKISVVPIIPLEDCLEELLAPRILSTHQKKLEESFHKKVTSLLTKNEGNSPSSEALENLLRIEELPVYFNSDKDLKFLHSCLRQIQGVNKFCSHKELLRRVEAFFNQGTKEDKMEDQLRKKIQQRFTKLPGDLLLLPSIEGLPFQPAIVWLRIIREVDEKNIALRYSEEKKDVAVRIGRLQPVFKYRITQMLAHVFSDIGLPSTYEEKIKNEIKEFILKI